MIEPPSAIASPRKDASRPTVRPSLLRRVRVSGLCASRDADFDLFCAFPMRLARLDAAIARRFVRNSRGVRALAIVGATLAGDFVAQTRVAIASTRRTSSGRAQTVEDASRRA